MDNNIRTQVIEWLDKSNVSKAQLAKMLDVNRSSLQRYLSGDDSLPEGTASKIEEAIKENIISPEALSAPATKARGKNDFIYTADAEGVLAVCQSCQDFMGFGVIVGKSGFGKTFALQYYARMPKVAYIECNESMNARDLVKKIEKALSLPHVTGTIDDRLDNIKDFFNVNEGYLLIVDEADKLITKFTQKKAEILRSIFDQSDVGIVLAGEPALEKTIFQYIPRMANRIDFKYVLHGLSAEEAIKYIDADADEEAERELIRRAINDKNGCFRLLSRTMANINRIRQNGEVISGKILKQAVGMM